jgi:Signal transduction histidine kinase
VKGIIREALAELRVLIRQSAKSWFVCASLATTVALLLLFTLTRMINVLQTKGFGAHGYCLLWLPGLIALYVSSDALIFLSYVCISLMLMYFVHKTWRMIPFEWVFIAFGVFIISCGITHFMDILTLWIPVYWLAGIVKQITADASAITAIALFMHRRDIFSVVHSAVASEERKQQLEQAHDVLQKEATSQNKNLVDLAEELIQASRLQRDFVATVSHEFRTALFGIQGFSAVMRDEVCTPEEIHEYASDIHGEAVRLGRMIANLLDLEQMRSGEMPFALKHIDLNALIRKVTDHFRLVFETHVFHLQLDDTLPQCMGDSDKLEQVVVNLLNNAMKYSPDGGKITVGSQIKEEMVQIWVQDYGIGIPPEFLDKVFDPYTRVGAARNIKGTGLGLSISRQIMQMHGGNIWAESSGLEGEGSSFYFTLPFSNEEQPQQPNKHRSTND